MRSWTGVMFVVALAASSCAGESSGADAAEDASAETPAVESANTTTTSEVPTTEASTSSTSQGDGDGVADSGDAAGCAAQSAGTTNFLLEAASVSHAVRVHLPESYDGTALPLVINWHGLGSNGLEQAAFTDYEALADTEGFVVIHPTGAPAVGDGRNGWELEQFDQPDRDDVAMADVLIDRMIADYCVDPDRIYSTGMSNGGYFTSRLVCELSDRIAAAVSVSGLSHYEGCRPTRPVPFMALHGTADGVVPYAGGDSTLLTEDSPQGAAAFFQQVMPDEFGEFAADFGCDSEPAVAAVSEEVNRYDYQGCADGVPMVFFEVIDGGHTWPGSPLGPLIENLVGLTTDDVSATADGWAFMSSHTLD